MTDTAGPLNPAASKSEPAVDTQAIDRDVACFACGYNLRGLMPSGTCPECGATIAPSLRSTLDYADIKWLKRVRAGVRWMFAYWMLALFVSMMFSAAFWWGLVNSWAPRSMWPLLSACVGIIMDSVLWAALAMVTAKERHRGAALDPKRTRWWTRGLALLLIPDWICSLTGSHFPIGGHGYPSRWVTMPPVIIACWLHLRRLSARGGDPTLASVATRAIVSYLTCCGLGMAMTVAYVLSMPRPPAPPMSRTASVFIAYVAIHWLLTLVQIGMQCHALFCFHRMFSHAITVRPADAPPEACASPTW